MTFIKRAGNIGLSVGFYSIVISTLTYKNIRVKDDKIYATLCWIQQIQESWEPLLHRAEISEQEQCGLGHHKQFLGMNLSLRSSVTAHRSGVRISDGVTSRPPADGTQRKSVWGLGGGGRGFKGFTGREKRI